LTIVVTQEEVDRLIAVLHTHRDLAMVLAMVLAGLRCCEVLGLRMADIWVGTGGCSSLRARGSPSEWLDRYHGFRHVDLEKSPLSDDLFRLGGH